MRVERELADLDCRIEAARSRLEAAYAAGKGEKALDRTWALLESLVDRREYLLILYADSGAVPLELALRVFADQVAEAFAELGRKMLELAEAHPPYAFTTFRGVEEAWSPTGLRTGGSGRWSYRRCTVSWRHALDAQAGTAGLSKTKGKGMKMLRAVGTGYMVSIGDVLIVWG